MSNWIESSLRDAVQALVRTGELDLAANLGRLLEEPEVSALRLYRSREAAELADRLYDCEDIGELAALLHSACSTFAVAHCTILRIRERNLGEYKSRVLSTYPDAWISEYIARRYFAVDPVIARALEGSGVFFWDEVRANDPITASFLAAAEAHGVGPAGITYVAENDAGDGFAVSLSVPLGHASFRQVFGPKLDDFKDIAALLVEVFGELTCAYPPTSQALTDDQLKVLKALASGSSLAELESMPVVYGSLSTLEKSILRSLDAKSLFQAVARAAHLRLLETLPLFEEDVYRPALQSNAA